MSFDDFQKYFGKVSICYVEDSFKYNYIKAFCVKNAQNFFRMEVRTPG